MLFLLSRVAIAHARLASIDLPGGDFGGGYDRSAVITDNGSEYRAHTFTDTLAQLSVEHRRIRSGRPQTNGHVERLQQTILEECWRPSFARSLVTQADRASSAT